MPVEDHETALRRFYQEVINAVNSNDPDRPSAGGRGIPGGGAW